MTVADTTTLTKRQREVLERFISGESIATIARDLRLSPWTVRAHLVKIAALIDRPKIAPMTRVLLYGASLLAEGS